MSRNSVNVRFIDKLIFVTITAEKWGRRIYTLIEDIRFIIEKQHRTEKNIL